MTIDGEGGSDGEVVRLVGQAFVDALTPPAFTSGEKIHSVVDAMQAQLGRDNSATGRLLRRLIKAVSMAGLLDSFRGQLPGWDQPDEWDQRLALAVGLALELVSDDCTIDVDASRAAARQVLDALFANVEPA